MGPSYQARKQHMFHWSGLRWVPFSYVFHQVFRVEARPYMTLPLSWWNVAHEMNSRGSRAHMWSHMAVVHRSTGGTVVQSTADHPKDERRWTVFGGLDDPQEGGKRVFRFPDKRPALKMLFLYTRQTLTILPHSKCLKFQARTITILGRIYQKNVL